MPRKNQAFTLIEMAMVLTIIGLIIGGILTGVSLIRSAQVQSVISEEDRYKKAVQLFKQKYLYLPGDLPTATSYWGTDTGCPSTGYSAAEAVPKTATCNGDGTGKINTSYKTWRAWQQLADAGFIDGAYSGIQGNNVATFGPYAMTVGINAPKSKVSNCGWIIGYMGAGTGLSGGYNLTINRAGTFLQLARGGGDVYYPGCLSPAEAAGIDNKIDDGLPLTGNMIEGGKVLWDLLNNDTFIVEGTGAWMASGSAVTAHTTTYPCETTAAYNTSSTSTTACDPFFSLGF